MRTKNRYFADQYWNRYFDFKTEYLIYQHLCKKLNKHKIKKIKAEQRFFRYDCWKMYVMKKFENLPEAELQEFLRYLNVKRKIESNVRDYLVIIVVPFLVAGGFDIIKTYWEDLDFASIDFGGLFLVAINTPSFLNKIIAIIIAMLGIIIVLLIICAVPIFFIMIIGIAEKQMNETAMRKSFIEDYQEIIKELIDDKT